MVTLALLLVAALAGWLTSELLHRLRAGSHPGEAKLHAASANESVAESEIDREVALFRDQYGSDQQFSDALRAAKLSLGELRTEVAAHLRERAWIAKQIAPQLAPTEEEIRAVYDAHQAQFTQPLRYRANHLFVAAPDGSANEVILAKLSEIEGLSIRQIAGEKFPALIAEASEDEATKTRGGGLDYFAARRMPPEFIAEVEKLPPNEISGPIRSRLGFHLLQVTETKPPRSMSYDEVRPEIALRLTNQRRALAVAALRERLGTPEFHAH